MAPGSQLLPRPLSSRQASLTVRWRTDWTMAEEDHADAMDGPGRRPLVEQRIELLSIT